MKSGDFKHKVTISRNGAPSQTAGGGNVKGSPTTWTKWAAIENRNGTLNQGNGKEWAYDYKITLRYEPSRPTLSNDLVTHEGKKMIIRSVQRLDEGAKKYEVLRCSRHE